MDNSILISVIVVTYNSEKYVVETLNSIKKQSYKNVELIITDDCSSDNTIEICENWLNSNNTSFRNVKIINSPVNTGIAPNCNRGILAANGHWIKLIAGDDLLLENCLQDNLLFVLNFLTAKVVVSNAIGFDAENKRVELSSSFIDKYNSSRKQYIKLLKNPLKLVTPTVFIHKSVLLKTKGFNERFPFIEDWPFWLKITKNNFRIHYFDKPTVLYRIHSGSISKAVFDNPKYQQSYLDHLQEVANCLLKIGRVDYFIFYKIERRIILNYYNPRKRKLLKLLSSLVSPIHIIRRIKYKLNIFY